MLDKQKNSRRILSLAFLFTLFRKDQPPPGNTETIIQQDDDESNFSRIRCPYCKWQPHATSRWICGGDGPPEHYKGCGREWNTFDTRGRCPGCKHQWRWTACLWCENYSLHEAWYTSEKD